MQLTDEQLIKILKTTFKIDKFGAKHWYLNGKRHRVDGPALDYGSGGKIWFINDMPYTEEEFNEKIKCL